LLNARPAPGLGPARGLFRPETTAGEGAWPATEQWVLTRESSATHRPPPSGGDKPLGPRAIVMADTVGAAQVD